MRPLIISLAFAVSVATGCASGDGAPEPEVLEPEWRPIPVDRDGQAEPAQLTDACTAAASSRTFAAAAAPASGALALYDAATGPMALIAAEDHHRVWIADATTLARTASIALPGAPHHIVVFDDHRAMVTVPERHLVVTLDLDRHQVIDQFTVGAEPRGLTTWNEATAAVALAGEAALALVHFDTGLQSKIALPFPDPRAVAKTKTPTGETRLIVGHLTQGRLSIVDVERATVVEHGLDNILNPYPGGGIFRPRAGHLRSLTSTPSGRVVAVHTVAHADPVRTLIGVNDDPCSGYGACDDDGPAAVDPAWSQLHFDDAGALVTSTTPLLQPSRRQDPQAIAVLDDDETSMLTLSVHRGSSMLALSCATPDAPLFAMHEVDVGAGANSLVLHPDGFALIYSAFARQVARVHIEDAQIVVDKRAVLARPTLSPTVELGRRLFHDSSNPAMSVDGRTACASCHPGGMTDNNTWTFAFGRRNTPSLRGGIMDTAPFHWPGDVEDMTHISDITVVGLMGGAGFSASDMGAIGAYLHQLPAPSSAAGARGQLTALEAEGAEIFASDETACLSCHSGPHGTDNHSYDVGTGLPFEDTSTYQVPLLHGLERTAPFLHDGRAPSLEILVDEWIRTDRMGIGSHLSDSDAAALVAYLRTR